MKFHLTKEKCVVAEGAKAFELATTDVCFGYLAGAARIFSLKTLAVRLGYRGRGGGGEMIGERNEPSVASKSIHSDVGLTLGNCSL